MNLRDFYDDVRNTLATIDQPFVVLVSKSTKDGGKAGVMTLVKRHTAARLIVEGRARLANDDETAAYFSDQESRRDQAEAERRFNATKLGFSAGEIVEQFCQLQGDFPARSKLKPQK